MKEYRPTVAGLLAMIALTGLIERAMGRSLLGPDARFGWWEGDIWSSENSQRVADPYSFSHIVHGFGFYALLWLLARKVPLRGRILLAVLLEGGWEILENSPVIINRYRAVTIALGYFGDSVVNSMSDVLMMSAGFLFAAHLKPWASLAAILILEVGCALWVRDNLTLNIIMLIYPIAAIRGWQMLAQPPH